MITIGLNEITRDKLIKLKKYKRETYEDVIKELIRNYEDKNGERDKVSSSRDKDDRMQELCVETTR